MWQFALTKQERLILMFILALWLCGLGVEMLLGAYPRAERYINPHFPRYDLNRVDYEELIESRAVSARLAEAIITHRSVNGNFTSLDELLEVKGIGPHRYDKLKSFFYIAGTP